MSEYQVVGKRAVRQDAVAKATGRYEYGMDFHLEGELHGAILRSPHAYAQIKSVDTTQARAMEGVRAVITAADLPADLIMPGVISDQPPLAREVVRFYGEPVALVAAESAALAQQAARAIEVEYEPLEPLLDPEEAMAADAPLLHPQWASYQCEEGVVRYRNVCTHAELRKGDVEAGFAEADLIFEDEFQTRSVHQSHVEPRVATGVFEGGTATVYTNTQLPYWIRTNVAHVLGFAEEQVNIITTGIGGGFGSKLYPQIEPLVVLLSRAANGRPVRMKVPIPDEMTAGLPRHPTKIRLKSGVNRDGTLVARQATLIVDGGAYAGSAPEIVSVGVLVLAGPYRTPHVYIDAYGVMTNHTNYGAYRGPGGPQNNFALESHLDRIAHELDIDPLQFRLHNLLGEGEEAANGQILENVGLREAVERAAAAIDWEEPAGPNRGKGLSLGWWTTTLQLSTSRVELGEGGKIIVNVGAPEIGTGAIMGGVPQVVAERMGVDLDRVEVRVTPTAEGLWDWGSQGSRTLFNVGRAAGFAADDLVEKMKDLAQKLLEVPAGQLVLRQGQIVNRENPEERLSLADLAARDLENSLQARAESDVPFAKYDDTRLKSCLYPAFHHPNFHCHAAEVEVDPATGFVTVIRYVAAHDIGEAINPTLIEGQIQGGVVQGIGMGLMEEILYDEEGRIINPNWTDYKLPTFADMPEIETIIVEQPTQVGPYGAKGLGESPVIYGPAVMANAIAQATGVRLYELPLTPERVLRGIRTGAAEDEPAG